MPLHDRGLTSSVLRQPFISQVTPSSISATSLVSKSPPLYPHRRLLFFFFGYIIDSVKSAFLTPPDKRIKFASLREDLLSHKSVSLKSLQKFVGKINSFTLVVPAARLFSRAACLTMSRASRSPRAIPVSRELKAELELWRFLVSWSGFLPWRDEKHSQLDVFSDASDSGWGGILRLPDQPQQELHGHWDLSERDLPIVVKETLALLYVLRRVADLISNARIDCFVDSATLVACWKKDGSRNTRVNDALKEIFHLTLPANLQVILHLVPSQQSPADSPSHIPLDRDCSLSPASWLMVQRAFGPHTIDLMATPANVQKDSSGRALPFFFCTITLTASPRRQHFLADSVPIPQCVCVSSVRACRPLDQIPRISKLPLHDCSTRSSSKKILVAASRLVLC